MVTPEEHLADLKAVHAALEAVLAVVSKLEHILASEDKRVQQSALKDASKHLGTAIDAVNMLGAHLRVAELMSEFSEEERAIIEARILGPAADEDEG